MNLQWKRVVVWVGLLAAGIGLGLLWSSRTMPRSPSRSLVTPWIGLPETGMDASSSAIREVLSKAATFDTDGASTDDPEKSFALRCGSPSTEQITDETYIVLIGQSFFTFSRQAWRVKFVVLDDKVEVTIQDARGLVFPPPPPPPPEPGDKAIVDIMKAPAARTLILRKTTLKPLADAWRNRSLWDAEQKPLGCSEGPTLILEGCVSGQYAVRDRGCDEESYKGMEALWNALQITLALPHSSDSFFPLVL